MHPMDYTNTILHQSTTFLGHGSCFTSIGIFVYPQPVTVTNEGLVQDSY